ncbi:MAG TPA: hypothetical protein VNN73_24175 [Blastocatellia bacterium]|nr:hypothetical protein [Blastocatellia bacterium]
MKIRQTILIIAATAMLAISVAAQDAGQPGFVITLKNGSTLRGRTLSRDEASGRLRLAMAESDAGEARTYAVIAPEDTTAISSSSADSDSIRIKLKGGSEIRCKEFSLNGDTVSIKLGTASKVEVRWDEIESISFGQ